MKILNLSLDKSILEKDSAVQKRLIALAEKVGELTVFVPAGENMVMAVSPSLTVHAIGGWKPFQLLKVWMRARRELRAKKYDLITVQDIYFLAYVGVKLSE